VQTLPARAGGGSVKAEQAYVVGEREPEVFVPNVSGTVLNREQILKNLGSLGGLNLNVAAGKGGDHREVVGAIQTLRASIENRNPQVVTNVAFAAADTREMDDFNRLQRSIARSSV
jgi:hypothetical protein